MIEPGAGVNAPLMNFYVAAMTLRAVRYACAGGFSRMADTQVRALLEDRLVQH